MMPEVLNILKSLQMIASKYVGQRSVHQKKHLVRRPGFQFGGGLHQRKRGIANKTVTGKNLLGKKSSSYSDLIISNVSHVSVSCLPETSKRIIFLAAL